MQSIKLISWNVNGLRACVRKGFHDWLKVAKPDLLGVQELRATSEQLDPRTVKPTGYYTYFNSAVRPGYAGTALYARRKPDVINLDFLRSKRFGDEGRLIEAHFGNMVYINGYYPNGRHDLSRVPFKLEFSEAVLRYAQRLRKQGKGIILGGDFNTAHQEIDLANPKSNQKNTGFLPEERAWLSRLIKHDYVDIFRHKHPQTTGAYTWWSQRAGVRERNVGWRIDYFFVSEDLIDSVKHIRHLPEVMASDHCPIELVLRY